MYRLSIALLFSFLANFLFSQNREADSLLKLLPKVNDMAKIDLYNDVALSYRGTSFVLVKKYSLKSYHLAREKHLLPKMIAPLTNLAIACVYTGNMDSAGILFNDIFRLADSAGDEELRNKALLNLGNYYLNTNNYDLALENYQLVYPEYLRLKDTLNMAGIEENTGDIYYHQKNYRKALQAFFMAKALYEQSNYTDEARFLFNNIGLTYLKLNLPDSAFYFLEKGLVYSKMKNNLETEMRIQNNLGLLFMEKENYPLSISYFRRSLRLAKEIANPYQNANGLLNLAQVFSRQKRFDSAFFYLSEAEPIVHEQGDNLLLKNLYENYYELHYQKKEFEKALYYFQKYKGVQDTILGQEIQNRISFLNIRFETAKKGAENIRLKSELDLKRITQRRLVFLLIVISLLFMSLGIAFYFFRKYQNQKQTIMEQEALLLKERLEHSQKEIASKALRLASQNEMRIKMIETTNEVCQHLDETGKESLKAVVRNLKKSIDRGAWQEFETRFEQVHEAFFVQLNSRFPDLTPNDRRICAFLKLNMSTKDIALLTNRSPRSIESARYRLKKKLGLGAEDDILNFLQSI
ncbi:MAG: tetratricopeptide repeat protein [Bacteroidales bacterium]|nr:tetratricopeptide repeat protein [Bacteroidales bacterium]MDD3666408.1 tetratricopeptide repeat protein [Bacteroidales bacterium]